MLSKAVANNLETALQVGMAIAYGGILVSLVLVLVWAMVVSI